MADDEAVKMNHESLQASSQAMAAKDETGGTGSDLGQEDAKSSKEEGGVTMVDVLKDERELEEDANAVLGGADDKNCTYFTGGYMKRQALYACITCSVPDAPNFVPSGICLACSYACHNDHQLVELYTKRNFRCDCGNERLQTNACQLAADKSPNNVDNRYNQNFRGLYCVCSRPYPDEDDEVLDNMIQCIGCEDWYHSRHIQLEKKDSGPPADKSYSEMICHLCSRRWYKQFLYAYMGLSVERVVPGKGCTKANDNLQEEDVEAKPVQIAAPESSAVKLQEQSSEHKGMAVCPLKAFKLTEEEKDKGSMEAPALFLTANWRENLCRCDCCMKIYSEEQVLFLCDPEDTVHFYEAEAMENGASQYEEGMKALSGMDRVKQVEAIQGYNTMKGSLMEYLKKFAENGKVVREEDIQEFFQQISNKRRKVEIPKFCR